MFFRTTTRRPAGPARPATRKAFLGIEDLEGRDMPAASPLAAVGPPAAAVTTVTNPDPNAPVAIGKLWQTMTASNTNTNMPYQNTNTSNNPSGYPYYVKVDNEIMRVTAAAGGITILNDGLGTNLTVVRGITGTPTPHAAGAPVVWLPNYGALPGGGGGGGGTTTGSLPATPTGLTATGISTTQISLSWTPVPGATSYVVQFAVAGGSWQPLGTTTGPGGVVGSLSPGTTYYFQVAAKNAAGQSGFGLAKYAETLPSVPTNFKALAASSSTVNLTWGAVTGAAGYKVQQLKNGVWTTVAQVAGNGSTSYAVPNLAAASVNGFRVAAYNTAGDGQYTAQVNALTWPAAPTNVVATTASGTQINLSWNAVPGVTAYYVYQAVGSGPYNLVKTLAAGQTSVPLPNLTPGTTYSFKVGAVNASGATFSNPVTGSTQVGLPAAPTGLTGAALSSTQVRLQWNPVAGAASYKLYYFNGSTWVAFGTAGSNSTIVNVPAGSTFSFAVAAVNSAGGVGLLSSFTTVTTPN